MKILRQFVIILLISFLGELLKAALPLPVPASVWGLILMLAALKTGVLKLSQVSDAAVFLIEIIAGHVYSCRSRSFECMGSAEARVDPDQCDHGRDYGSGNGSDCKSDTDCHTQ